MGSRSFGLFYIILKGELIMYTVKITNSGTITFRGSPTRLPATFNKVCSQELKLIKVICRANNFIYEILEKESERLAFVAEKVRRTEYILDSDEAIEGTEVEVEELFESDNTLGDLLKNLDKE